MENKSQEAFQLIDVDCNLIHPDLHQFHLALERSESEDDFHETTSKVTADFFRILSHPSVKQATITAVFSPSSTIAEAHIFLQALENYSETPLSSIPIATSVGVHPYHVLDSSLPMSIEQARTDICELLTNDKYHPFIKCIGETGLDYSEGFPDKEKQIPWWELQVSLALEYQLPLFVHERLAFVDVVHTLEDTVFVPRESHTRIPVLIHCFTGTREECRFYIARGCFISVSGYILRSGLGPEEVQACLKEGIIPLDKLMIETDSPYMGFPSCRDLYFDMEGDAFQVLSSKQKKRLLKGTYPNVPSSLPKVLDRVVHLLNEGKKASEHLSKEYVASVIFENSLRFFNFDRTRIKSY